MRVEGVELRAQDSGFRVQGSGLRAKGSGFMVHGAECRVQGAGCRVHVHGSWYMAHGSGFRVQDSKGGAQGHIRGPERGCGGRTCFQDPLVPLRFPVLPILCENRFNFKTIFKAILATLERIT